MLLRSLAVLALTLATLLVPATAHADTSYTGVGDQVLRIRLTKSPGLLALTHTGESNFIVTTVNSSGKQEQLLVNEIGPYKGTVLYNGDGTTKSIAAVQIKADGAWSAVFKPPSKARCWCTATVQGSGDQVLKLSPTRGLRTVTAAHSGESNFIVQSYTRPGSWGDLLFNDIGSYQGSAVLPAGTRLVTVKADGPWTLKRR
ncbi:hypothetical protein [Nonomuraea jabiensis]|uniref:Uncharacterized protein n=1 Tax=Nonomuraea jabiensis TaxID=882448 RepID=A0A7W9FY63_9ACTN|nr:hypothetical protein [Nonomuraea jabiensis]MBB5773732.1 hypothetical protein [Nonomuraea jabiensis]